MRSAKLAAVTAGLAKLDAGAKPEIAAPVIAKPAEVKADASAAIDPAVKPDEPVVEAKDPAPDDKPDEKTAKALAAIDKQAKKFRDEQATAKAELALERAELARLRADATGKAFSLEEIQKLAKRDPIAALAKLGIESEDDWERVGRGAFPRTKAGKADPRSQATADDLAHKSAMAAELAELRKQQSEMADLLKQRDAQSQSQAFVAQWKDAAVKAIPSTPTLIGKLHEKSPEKAKETLRSLGAHMEAEAMREDGATRYDPSYTPSHAEVIAEYEKLRRAELEEQGVDVDALLTGGKARAPIAAPAKTLDPTAPTGTRPINGTPNKSEKLAAVSKGLSKLWAADT